MNAKKAAASPNADSQTGGHFSEREARSFVPPKRKGALGGILAGLDLKAVPVRADKVGPSEVGDLVFGEIAPVWIHHSKMSVWRHNPRHVIDEEKLDRLGKSIAQHGQSDPVDAFEDPDRPGHYLILRGQRRWLSISRGNLQEGLVLTRVLPGAPSIEQLLASAVETQENTEQLSDIDFAISLVLLADEAGVRALSRMLGRSASDVSKLTQIGNLPERILGRLKVYPAKFSTLFAYEVVLTNQKAGEDKALELVELIVEKALTHRATVAAREKLLGERAPIRRSSWSTIRLSTGSKEPGSLRIKESSGEMALKVKGLTPAGMELIKDAVNRATTEAAAQASAAASES